MRDGDQTAYRAGRLAGVAAAGLGALAQAVLAAPAWAADPTDQAYLEDPKLQEQLMDPAERSRLDLSGYTVTDPTAGFFDVGARRRWLRQASSPMIRAEVSGLSIGMSCRSALELPVINERFSLPGFYPQPDSWRLAAEPLFKFEDAISRLSGHYVVSGDDYYADCLSRMLDRWAEGEGFLHFEYKPVSPQAWFGVESSLFAAGFAYATVRDHVHATDPERARRIEAWLRKASERHISFKTTALSCCNNHFYRRALHATIIGIVTDDDDLFRYGVSALYSALHEMNPDGSLPRELMRGSRLIHYQNYAVLYLVTIMELVERQGYPIYELEVGGHTIHDAVEFDLAALEDPEGVGRRTGTIQDLWFMEDPQYFGWMELYGNRFPSERIDRLARTRRPIYNRSAGGFLTLYFYRPSESEERTEVASLADRSFRLDPDYCAKHPQWRDERDTAWRRFCEERLRALAKGADAKTGIPDPELVHEGDHQ
ncbi:MAG: alginate lyase family protein [Thalassobaculum sp.]|uniref:alginate lyase family protein n=1 Tax=Thalassobaculum sp. TaxID=2022740 RepID=UPI0032EDC078